MSEMGERIPIQVHSSVNVHRLLCRPIDKVKEITHSGGNCKVRVSSDLRVASFEE